MAMHPRRIFLTGGTGYLGGAIVAQLLENGYRLRLLARKKPIDAASPMLETVAGGLSDVDRLAEYMQGCDAAIHSAALVASWARDPAEFYRTNVQGLVNMIAAARKASIGTLIYTSSLFALGPAGLPGAKEDAALIPQKIHPYQHSKVVARQIAMRARDDGLPIVILYPGVIYGPGKKSEGNMISRLILDFVGGQVPGLLGGGKPIWSYAYIKDVARGHALALERCPAGGEFILGGPNVSLRVFFEVLGRLTGREIPKWKIPTGMGMILGGLEFGLARLCGRQPRMTPATVRMMCLDWACDSSLACANLGYLQTPLLEGLRETLLALEIPEKGDG